VLGRTSRGRLVVVKGKASLDIQVPIQGLTTSSASSAIKAKATFNELAISEALNGIPMRPMFGWSRREFVSMPPRTHC